MFRVHGEYRAVEFEATWVFYCRRSGAMRSTCSVNKWDLLSWLLWWLQPLSTYCHLIWGQQILSNFPSMPTLWWRLFPGTTGAKFPAALIHESVPCGRCRPSCYRLAKKKKMMAVETELGEADHISVRCRPSHKPSFVCNSRASAPSWHFLPSSLEQPLVCAVTAVGSCADGLDAA